LCGIVGFTHKDWIPDPGQIQRATATLVHRGPNQQGVYESSMFSMGATRLRIIDLEGGDQPFLTEDGNTVIAFNGEIYNHLELRAELEELGHPFRSHCDTETVLRAFVQWDTQCFARLRGMFAIALWNESSKRLVIARDRLGIKPLYIARCGEDVFFGSELKALFVHPDIDRRLSLRGLECYLSLNYVPGPWTLIEGIEKLAPGEWLAWQEGEVTTGSYWCLPLCRDHRWTLESARDQLDYLLRQSMREHLISNVPLGMWLSGGIDSSTILHYAATGSGGQLRTFSISFQGHSFDESAYIRQVVNHYGTEHAQLDLNPACDLYGAIEEFAYYSDEPSADAGALPVWFLSRLSKSKTTVSLSGEGADELFGGYLTYRADRLSRAVRPCPKALLRLVLDCLQAWPVSDEKISFEYKLKRFFEGCMMSPERAHVHWNGTFSDEQKCFLLDTPLPAALNQILARVRSLPLPGSLAPYLWFDQKYYLPDDILVKTDRMSMAHALEVRPPFLDHRIVEFAASLPDSCKVRGLVQKVLLRELMKGKLPPRLLTRKKVGFDIPAHEWLRGPLRPLLEETLLEAATEHPQLFSWGAVEQYLRAHLERKANYGYHLWGLMILFLWMKKWHVQATAPADGALTQKKTGTFT
jgi:asparagine synthase (glutamine-hydrolysing)